MKAIHTDLAPGVIGAYSQAIQSGQTVYLSGQLPLCPQTMEFSHDIHEQIEQVIRNLSAVCEASGGSLAKIVKLTVYLTDLAHFPLVNEVMKRHFTEPYPARAAIEVSALPKGANVEIEGIMSLA